jgi:predicted TPR repeat methyltransferase
MMQSDEAKGRQAYFDHLYRLDPDPWRYQTGDYEIAKRRDTLSFLRPRYANACEVGCSIGVLTEDLAARCDKITGVDVSPTAAELARHRLAGLPNAEILVLHLPHDDIDARFDLLVLSEMLYFLNEDELVGLAAFAARRVEPGGDLLIVSFDGETQTRLNGKMSTERFISASAARFDVIRSEQREHYHVRLLRRRHERA